MDAAAPADVASAPVQVSGPTLPAAKLPTSSAPKTPKAELPSGTTPDISIPSLNLPDTPTPTPSPTPRPTDGENLPSDGKADPNDLATPRS